MKKRVRQLIKQYNKPISHLLIETLHICFQDSEAIKLDKIYVRKISSHSNNNKTLFTPVLAKTASLKLYPEPFKESNFKKQCNLNILLAEYQENNMKNRDKNVKNCH